MILGVRIQTVLLTLVAISLAACASGAIEPDASDVLQSPASEMPTQTVYVTKQAARRSEVQLHVKLVRQLDGETQEQTVARALGLRTSSSLEQVIRGSVREEQGANPQGGQTPEPASREDESNERAPNGGAEPSEPPVVCNDSCRYAFDGECDDGQGGSETQLCASGTDCADCRGDGTATNYGDDSPSEEATEPVNEGFGGQSEPNVEGEPAIDGVGAACRAGGMAGSCLFTWDCPGHAFAGFCPGGVDVQCCISDEEMDAEAVSNDEVPDVGQACETSEGDGSCQDVSVCDGTSVPGYCAGPNHIQCCIRDDIVTKAVPIAYGVVVGVSWVSRALLIAYRARSIGQTVVGVSRVTRVVNSANVVTQVTISTSQQAVEDARDGGYRGGRAMGPTALERRANDYFRERTREGEAAEAFGDTGRCDPDTHRRLQDDVDRYCKPGEQYRCGIEGQSCDDTDANFKRLLKCVDARQTINNHCFDGGDTNHKQRLEEDKKALYKCGGARIGRQGVQFFWHEETERRTPTCVP